jgi:hypothetical protein
VAHEIVQVKIFGPGKALIRNLEHLYPLQDEHPYLLLGMLCSQLLPDDALTFLLEHIGAALEEEHTEDKILIY